MLKKFIKPIIALASAAGVLTLYSLFRSTTPEEMQSKGFTPEISAKISCLDENGNEVYEDNTLDNIITMSIDPVAIRIGYERVLDDHYRNIGREHSIITGVDGCTFQENFTSSDLTEMRQDAPILVHVFDSAGKEVVAQRYTSIKYSPDIHVFEAELRDKDGDLLESLEVIGLSAFGISKDPNSPIIAPN